MGGDVGGGAINLIKCYKTKFSDNNLFKSNNATLDGGAINIYDSEHTII